MYVICDVFIPDDSSCFDILSHAMFYQEKPWKRMKHIHAYNIIPIVIAIIIHMYIYIYICRYIHIYICVCVQYMPVAMALWIFVARPCLSRSLWTWPWPCGSACFERRRWRRCVWSRAVSCGSTAASPQREDGTMWWSPRHENHLKSSKITVKWRVQWEHIEDMMENIRKSSNEMRNPWPKIENRGYHRISKWEIPELKRDLNGKIISSKALVSNFSWTL